MKKKYLSLVSIAMLTLFTAVGCKKDKEPVDTGSNKTPSSDTGNTGGDTSIPGPIIDDPDDTTPLIEDDGTIVGKWGAKLQGNFKLSGVLQLSITPVGELVSPITVGLSFEVQFSHHKCYAKKGKDIKYIAYYDDSIKQSVDSKKLQKGDAVLTSLTTANVIRNTPILNDNNEAVKFNDKYVNKLHTMTKDDYEIIGQDETSFNFKDETKVSELVSNITQINLPFEKTDVDLTDTDDSGQRSNKLRLRGIGSLDEDHAIELEINGEKKKCTMSYYFTKADFDFNVYKAFNNPTVKEETEDSKGLQNALDEMKSLSAYKITETRQQLNGNPVTLGEYTYIDNSTTKAMVNTTKNTGWGKFSNDEYYNFNISKDDNNKDVFNLNQKYTTNGTVQGSRVNPNTEPGLFDVRYDTVDAKFYTVNSDGTYTFDNKLLTDGNGNSVYKDVLRNLIPVPEQRHAYDQAMNVSDYKIQLKEDANGKSHLGSISFTLQSQYSGKTTYTYTYSQTPVDVSSYDFNIDTYNKALDEEIFNTYLVEPNSLKDNYGRPDTTNPYYSTGLKIEIAKSTTALADIKVNDVAVTSGIYNINNKLSFKHDSADFDITKGYDSSIGVTVTKDGKSYNYDLYTEEVVNIRKAGIQALDEFDLTNKDAIDALDETNKMRVTMARRTAEQTIGWSTTKANVDTAVQTYKNAVNAILNPAP